VLHLQNPPSHVYLDFLFYHKSLVLRNKACFSQIKPRVRH